MAVGRTHPADWLRGLIERAACAVLGRSSQDDGGGAERHAHPRRKTTRESSYGCCEREYLGRATHAAHNAATVATKAKKALRLIPLTAASTALMAKMPAVTTQKPAVAAT